MDIFPLIKNKQKRFGVLRKMYIARKRVYDDALSTLIERIAKIKANPERSSKLRIAYLSGRVKSILSIINKAILSNVSAEKALSTIEDIVGIRIVVNNFSDIEPLFEQLRKLMALLSKQKRNIQRQRDIEHYMPVENYHGQQVVRKSIRF